MLTCIALQIKRTRGSGRVAAGRRARTRLAVRVCDFIGSRHNRAIAPVSLTISPAARTFSGTLRTTNAARSRWSACGSPSADQLGAAAETRRRARLQRCPGGADASKIARVPVPLALAGHPDRARKQRHGQTLRRRRAGTISPRDRRQVWIEPRQPANDLFSSRS
jgi:hypothetical protein